MFIAYAVKCFVKTALVAFCANGEHIKYFEKSQNIKYFEKWFLILRLSEDLNSCSMLRHWVYANNHITSQEFRWVKFCTAFLQLQSAVQIWTFLIESVWFAGLLLKTRQKVRILLFLVFTLIAIALLVIFKQRHIYCLNWNFAVNNS